MGADLNSDDVTSMLQLLTETGPTMMDLWGTDFLTIVDEEVPVDTHNLQWSIPGNTERGLLEWVIGTNVEYAPPVHEGHMTRPAIKYPERSKGQRFIEGNPFFDRTLDQTEIKLQDYLTEALEGVS